MNKKKGRKAEKKKEEKRGNMKEIKGQEWKLNEASKVRENRG